MKTLLLSFAALLIIGLPFTASAGTITFQAPATAPNDGNGGAKQFDLDHHRAYAWRVDNVNLRGETITGATLTFSNIRNWDSNPNMLFVHLLDSAKSAGVSSFQDATGTPVPWSQIADNFAGSLYAANPLVAGGTANTLLTSRSFTTSATTYVYNFSQSQIQTLSTYLSNGNNFALGFDPDCHFWNNGITLQINTTPPTPNPEPTTIALLGTGVVGYFLKRRRKQQTTD